MRLKISLMWAMLICVTWLCAAPYQGEVFIFKQPDGTKVQVKLYGDEYFMRAESMDGYTVIRDKTSGWICYARLSEEHTEFVSTGIYYSANPLKSTNKLQDLGLIKHLNITQKARSSVAKAIKGQLDKGPTEKDPVLKTTSNPLSGNIKGLTIVVDFSDEVGSVNINTIKDFCNKSGFTGFGNNGSIKDYWYDISGGVVIYENIVYGYYRAPKTFAQYNSMEYGAGAKEILQGALTWIDNQGFNFNDLTIKNGRIQAINLMYTGTPRDWAKGMWYHKGWYTGFSADGVTTGDYNTSPVNSDMGIGTICHENGHMLGGWPDTYKYNDNTGPDGIGAFDLMCNYGSKKNPVPPNPHFRNMAGWGSIVNINSANQTYTENSNSLKSYKYTNPSNSKEFFLIEPRRKTGRSAYLPDEGLTIWHIDQNGDNQTTNHEVYLEHANNNINSHGGACWHSGGTTAFNDNTSPNAKWKNGVNSGLEISEVGSVGASMGFTVGSSGGSIAADMTSPTPGTTLSSTSVTFNWNRPSGATNFDILVGTTGVGSTDIRSSSTFNATSKTVSGLPNDGSTIYVRLWTKNGGWEHKDYTYTASYAGIAADMTSPTPGTTLSSTSVTFNWNRPSGATNFDILVGTTGVGSTDIRSSSTFNATSKTVSGLPNDGSTIYVRLWTKNGGWEHKDYTYTASNAGIAADMTSPTPGTTLSSTSVTFNWNRPSGATNFDILVGTTGVGSTDIRSSSTFNATSKTVSGLPNDGSTIYVRLWTKNGGWEHKDYTYTATNANFAVITSPAPGTYLNSSAVTFRWNRPAAATHVYLRVGSQGVNSNDVFQGYVNDATSKTVSGIPTNGNTVYVRLYTYLNGWKSKDYTYGTASSPSSPRQEITEGVSVFPSPVSDELTVQLGGMEDASITIAGVDGKLVYKSSENNISQFISVAHFTPGLYIIRIEDQEKSITQKIIVE